MRTYQRSRAVAASRPVVTSQAPHFPFNRSHVLVALILSLVVSSVSMPVAAEVSGLRVYIAENEVDWNFDDVKREADITELSFQIEEQIDTGTRLGAGLGYLNVSLRGEEGFETRRFDAQFIEFFMRHPFMLTESLELNTKFNYRYNTGDDDDDDDSANIDWSEAGIELGIGIQFSRMKMTPYAAYRYLDGDLDADSGSESFDLDDRVSGGLRLDLYVDNSSYVGVALESGDYSRFYLTFATEY